MIMKLEVRVPFDTDLERLRKIVKQAGAELKADPEIGPMFLQPLKSQGVNRIDNSAFIVRVKFMARPNGEAFVLRRHVFRHLQEAFQKMESNSPRIMSLSRAKTTRGCGDGGRGPVSFDRRIRSIEPSPRRRGAGALKPDSRVG